MTRSDLGAFLTQIGRHPILTKEAQLLHGYRVQAWKKYPEGEDKAPPAVQRAGRRSLETMVRTNLRLVVSVAKQYQGRGLELPDLIQEGSLGLIRGIELWDPTRGYSVTTYSFWWIRQAITRALHNQGRIIRLPINTQEQLGKIAKIVNHYRNTKYRDPSLSEVAHELQVPEAKLRLLLDLAAMTSCSSLDAVSTAHDDVSKLNLIANPPENGSTDPERVLQETHNREMVQDALDSLSRDEAYLVRRVHLEGSSVVGAARELEISRSRATQLLTKALRRIKIQLLMDGYRP